MLKKWSQIWAVVCMTINQVTSASVTNAASSAPTWSQLPGTVSGCECCSATLLWNYTSSSALVMITWQRLSTSPPLQIMYVSAAPGLTDLQVNVGDSYTDRLSYVPMAGFSLSQLVPADSGQYQCAVYVQPNIALAPSTGTLVVSPLGQCKKSSSTLSTTRSGDIINTTVTVSTYTLTCPLTCYWTQNNTELPGRGPCQGVMSRVSQVTSCPCGQSTYCLHVIVGTCVSQAEVTCYNATDYCPCFTTTGVKTPVTTSGAVGAVSNPNTLPSSVVSISQTASPSSGTTTTRSAVSSTTSPPPAAVVTTAKPSSLQSSSASTAQKSDPLTPTMAPSNSSISTSGAAMTSSSSASNSGLSGSTTLAGGGGGGGSSNCSNSSGGALISGATTSTTATNNNSSATTPGNASNTPLLPTGGKSIQQTGGGDRFTALYIVIGLIVAIVAASAIFIVIWRKYRSSRQQVKPPLVSDGNGYAAAAGYTTKSNLEALPLDEKHHVGNGETDSNSNERHLVNGYANQQPGNGHVTNGLANQDEPPRYVAGNEVAPANEGDAANGANINQHPQQPVNGQKITPVYM